MRQSLAGMLPHSGVKKGATGYARGAPQAWVSINVLGDPSMRSTRFSGKEN
jgi:hypothetical protein